MPSDVVPQVDVGSLSLKSLTAFTPLLAALTSDDVAPPAMIQLESLGALFHTNGQYARRVPDLLCRCSSKRLDLLGMAVGWRKGDAASLMAQSAGGQAITLLCFCLKNICKNEDIGSILHELSEKMLSKRLTTSSLAQLTRVSNLLASKTQAIGFGNILASQVVRIHDVYDRLDKALPRGFYESMTQQSIVDLYHSLSKAFCNKDALIRVSGIHAMGHIMAIVLIMFPESVMLIVEGLLVQEAAQASIILEINSADGSDSPTTIRVEERLSRPPFTPLPIEIEPRLPSQTIAQYTFQWPGHITDGLRVAFANFGLKCSADLIEACCDLFLITIPLIKQDPISQYDTPLPLGGIMDLLGSEPTRRIYHVCNVVFGMTPPGRQKDVPSAYSALVDAFKAIIGPKFPCTCAGTVTCDLTKGWETVRKLTQSKSAKNCLHRALWRNVGSAMTRGFQCLLVDAERNVSISYDANEEKRWKNFGTRQIECCLETKGHMSAWTDCHRAYRASMELGGHIDVDKNDKLALSNGSSTILPASLLNLQTDTDRGYRFNLYDGQLLIKGRYHERLQSAVAKVRPTAQKSLLNYKGRIKPSSSGEHSLVSCTVRETLGYLELRTTVLIKGHSIHLDLTGVIRSSMGLNDSHVCEHDPSAEMETALRDEVLTTSIAIPFAEGHKITIVQTKDNPTAQLLACEAGKRAMLQRRCCLDCAVSQAKAQGIEQIIVAC